MEFLDIPLFDNDLYKMILRFLLNLSFLFLLIHFIYFKYSKKTDYVFTFYIVGVVVFFVCFGLKKYELNMGMALGLFAVFGILRYRTNPVDIKDMTYLFVVIGMSIINALFNKKMSYSEVLLFNGAIVLIAGFLEHSLLKNAILRKVINYEKIENVHPQNKQQLIDDIEARLGIHVVDFKIGDVDLLKDTAIIYVSYQDL